jgi:DNA mismatch repair protein MutS2
MDVRTLRALEWDRVLALLSLCASTAEGKGRARSLLPAMDKETVRSRHERVRECLAGETLAGRLSLEGYQRTQTSVPTGLAFPIETLRTLRGNLRVLNRALAWLADPSSPKPALLALAPKSPALPGLSRLLEKTLDDRGDVADGASDRLRGIRRERERARGQVLGRMEALVDRLGGSVLRDTTYTIRGGRLVLPVQASRKGDVKGILHDVSSTGATAFIEPMEVVDLNNRLAALDGEEREEIARILVEVSGTASEASPELESAYDFLESLDLDLACARLGKAAGGHLPDLAEDGEFDLRQARHPLLVASLSGLRREAWGEAPREEAVPLDLALSPAGTKTLVISGPNAGGKSVALKTAGLLCLMNQAGIPIPAAEGTRLPVFPFVHATVGDTQSILDSLSTFSARMAALKDAMAGLKEPFLVILDELGSGTDPAEGAALGEAVLLHFHRRRGFTLASTHYESIKARALTTDGMGNAGMEFEEDGLRPTFRLKMGQVGASRALEIAERSGIEAGVLREARAFLPEGEKHLREILSALDEEIAAHEREILRLKEKEKELDGARAQVQKARASLENEKRRLLEGLPERLEAWREAFLTDLKAEVNRQTVKRVATKALPKLAERAASDLGLEKPEERPRAMPEPGDRVRMRVYGLEGDVVGTDAGTGRLTVDCRGKTLVVGHGDVEILARGQQRERPRGGGVEGPGKDAAWEINLIGQTVAEAEAALEPFMDRAALAGLGQVRIIHGIGTGRLRAAVRQWLKACPYAANWEEAPPSGGGAGATLVSLKT